MKANVIISDIRSSDEEDDTNFLAFVASRNFIVPTLNFQDIIAEDVDNK